MTDLASSAGARQKRDSVLANFTVVQIEEMQRMRLDGFAGQGPGCVTDWFARRVLPQNQILLGLSFCSSKRMGLPTIRRQGTPLRFQHGWQPLYGLVHDDFAS